MTFHLAGNPAELALPYADMLANGNCMHSLEPSEDEAKALAELQQRATALGMIEKMYLVHSRRALAAPEKTESNKDVTGFDFNQGLDYLGRFVSYDTAPIKLALGGGSIRAVCLKFDNVILLPHLDNLEGDDRLYTPAYSVKTIELVETAS